MTYSFSFPCTFFSLYFRAMSPKILLIGYFFLSVTCNYCVFLHTNYSRGHLSFVLVMVEGVY